MYYILEAHWGEASEDLINYFKTNAIGHYHCIGIEDYMMDEAQVDELLGERSYCGGDVPDDVFEDLERYIDSNSGSKFFFENLKNAQYFAEQLKENKIDQNLITLDSQDWNLEWKKHYAKIEIPELMSVVPSWESEDAGNEDIIINPGMGFGTGGHETTYMCLSTLKNIELKNVNNCFDYGCGSGILGIALKIKNPNLSSCILYDIDDDALDNCRENIALNKVGTSDFQVISSYDFNNRDTKYDLVFANILLNVLTDERENIIGLLDNNAHLIISGVLRKQEEEIKKLYSDLELITIQSKNDWLCFHYIKR